MKLRNGRLASLSLGPAALEQWQCDQGWPGYSTASVRSIMTPTICCWDQRRRKSVIKGGQGTQLPQSEVQWPLPFAVRIREGGNCQGAPRLQVSEPSHLCQTWNWSGSELCDLVWPAWHQSRSELSAPAQPAWKRSGSELSAILSNQHGTDQDQNCLPLSDQHFLPLSNPQGNDLDQNFLPFCPTSMELIRIGIVCPCLTSSMTTEHLLQERLLVLALHDADCFRCYWLVQAGGEESFSHPGTSGRPAQHAAAFVYKELVS